MVKVKPKASPTGFCAYLGPSIRGVVQNGTIYEGTKETVIGLLAGQIEQYPRIAKLIIPGDELPEARVKIKTKGNYLFEENRRFVAELQKGV